MTARMTVRGLCAAALVTTLYVATARADAILPTGLAPGSQYQIAFVTADTITAESDSESTYNNFVTAEAANSPALASLGASWTAITSTADGANASTNAATFGVPIYNTLGQLVVGNGALYGTWDSYNGYSPVVLSNPIVADQNGTSVSAGGVAVWTGSEPDGNAAHINAFQLGATNGETLVGQAEPGLADNHWITYGEDNILYYGTPISHPVYALSSVITVPVPEPTTLAILGSALPGLAAVYLRRRKVAG